MQERQGCCQDLFYTAGVVDGDAFSLSRGQIFLYILPIVSRQNDVLDSGATGGKELLLDTADWQDVSAQGYLARHGREGAGWECWSSAKPGL